MNIDTPFIYSRTVTKDDFIGRSEDVDTIFKAILSGGCIALYGAPKCGKSSIINESIRVLESEKEKCLLINVDLCSVRSRTDLVKRLYDSFSRYSANVPETEDLKSVLQIPYIISSEKENTHIIVVLDNFHNILHAQSCEKIFACFENTMKDNAARLDGEICTWIFTGSAVNAMKEIFERQKFFFRIAKTMVPQEINKKILFRHITHNLLIGGKVIEEDQMERIHSIFGGNIYYINHLMAICDHLSNGLVTVPVVDDALKNLLSIHMPEFRRISDDLTGFQTSFVKAVLDGVKSFSSQETIQKYSLNSSANVKRVREALMKKEIIDFDSNSNPFLIDPLFDYWMRNYFFGKDDF